MKVLLKIIVVLIIIVAVLFLAKDMIAKKVLVSGTKAVTGLTVDVEKIQLGIATSLIDVSELMIYNPAGYQDELMADIPEIYADYQPGKLLKKQLHLNELRFYLKELVVVKNKDGKLNLDSLRVVKAEKPAEKKEPAMMEEKPVKEEAKGGFQIDILKLRIDKVVYKDYTQGDKPMVREYNVNINEQFEDISDPQSLAKVILVKAIVNTSISRLANFDVTLLSDSVSGVLDSATGIASEAASSAMEAGKQVGEKAGKAMEEAGEKTKEAIDKIFPLGE